MDNTPIKRFILPIIFAVAFVSVAATLPFSGKSGAKLKDAVAATSRPVNLAPNPIGFFNALESGGLTDRFSGTFHVSDGDGRWPDGLMPVAIVPGEWWRFDKAYYSSSYRDTVQYDLYNLMVGTYVAHETKSVYPPARLERVTTDLGAWQIGLLTVDGVETRGWMPPSHLRGDCARAIFYMITLYPTTMWDPWAMLVLDESIFPGFQPYGVALLMEWHRDDPVSADERRRNEVASVIQGNRNLFVDYPDLAEFLWGRHAGEVFTTGEEERIPLRSTYKISEPRIDLWSPRVGEEAVWSVDGRGVAADHVVPRELGAGMHEFSYTLYNERGKVMILITS